jgi:hypothetical protein
VQHARYKDQVTDLANKNGIYLGQILAYSDPDEFWDPGTNFSRLKQYQLDKYLRLVDDGWINRKGQYYRGAIQSEDEAAWGLEFFKNVLSKDRNLEKHFFILRNSLNDIPHKEDENVGQLIRSQSKVISDGYPEFMDLRVKIHSQPEASDIQRVNAFVEKNRSKLTPDLLAQFSDLLKNMALFFKPFDVKMFTKELEGIKNTEIRDLVTAFVSANGDTGISSQLISDSADLMWEIRRRILFEKDASARLQLMEISLKLEELIFKNEVKWQPTTIKEQLQKICDLGLASAAAGYIEIWEWEQIGATLALFERDSLTLEELTGVLERARGEVEWSTSMFKAHFEEVVAAYVPFEPLANGFVDDKIRSSLVLQLGKSVGELGVFIAQESSLTNKVLDLKNQSSIRGLNPGYALGELVVVTEMKEEMEVSSNKIYIFQRPPSDLKPVAGIATVAEGNLVSHVQLLARNLGIPNAALSDENLKDLEKYNGTTVFFAVSNKGNVIIKDEKDLNPEERALFTKKIRKEDKIAVPVKELRLDVTTVLNMRDVDASNSGKLCGPKAANLGQLKKMFPDQVVEGLVIPFGIFKGHMDQPMPGQEGSYWDFLNVMFEKATRMREANMEESVVEQFQLSELQVLREAIKKIALTDDFIADLESSFKAVLGKELGSVPVFLRSDTNMEDLKDFTGAGLNLTIFNTVERDKIIQGIKDVWASPYTERSFKWRQKYLLNPENVFPSILVIPSVDVDYSGVMITKGINIGTEEDLTVAFSRGAGGAVDGQASETYLIMNNGFQLLAPSREVYFNRLPETGGTKKQIATFESAVLNTQNIQDLRNLAKSLRTILPEATGSDYKGAYDVELGFKDNKLWLFQIRPFVENKNALGSAYLESITPKIKKDQIINLSTKL